MGRRRYVWDPEATDQWGGKGAMVEVSPEYTQPVPHHYVIPDTPDYVSPVTGLVVSGRKQRRNDLRSTGSRPYEGRQIEEQEASRRKSYEQAKSDRKLDEAAHRAYYQMPLAKRRQLGCND